MKCSVVHMIITMVSGILLATGFGCSPPTEQDRINIAEALSSPAAAACFEKADAPIIMEFPRDAGSHDTFQTEWWYYTGNLKTTPGRHFGYQLTFFRQALSCEPVKGASKWRTQQLYFAHFAITDTQANAFFSDLRMNRQSIGLAGARGNPYQVWIDDWRAQQIDDHLVLTASGEGITLHLVLSAIKPVLLQGNRGLSRKGREPFNASYYYSLPRLETRGTLEIGPDKHRVTGNSWFDHEWSTRALDADVAGWDWFSVHLDDGRDLMVCQVRGADGQPNGYAFGSISFPDGRYKILSADAFSVKIRGIWKSPTTDRQYPGQWEIRVPDQDFTLAVTPVIQNQEHTHLFSYWEGAARFTGKGIKGLGYVELTGY